MSNCQNCDNSLTTEQKIALHAQELIENKKAEARRWAATCGFSGTLYIIRTKNGYSYKRLEYLEGREIIEAFYVN